MIRRAEKETKSQFKMFQSYIPQGLICSVLQLLELFFRYDKNEVVDETMTKYRSGVTKLLYLSKLSEHDPKLERIVQIPDS